MTTPSYDWSELAFGSKKPLRSLSGVFISAPRQVSQKRLIQLIKTYLPTADIILGIGKEEYVDGFDGQAQFRMLRQADVQTVIDKVNRSASTRKIYTLAYFQRELPIIIEKLQPSRMVAINGSWQYTFHTRPEYYVLSSLRIHYQLVSPFTDEAEAQSSASKFSPADVVPPAKKVFDDHQLMELATQVAAGSFDYSFQTGAVLARRTDKGYVYLESGFNQVIPYQTYAMHRGASRETHFSPPNDLNHYDTIHAEMAVLVSALERRLDLTDTSLFVNLMPCPACAKTLSQTAIAEFVYRADHSEGYAVKLFEASGKTVRRIV